MFDNTMNADGKPAIVLVHGAWADSSCWNGVIAQLQARGFTVYAPPNPLRGLASDAASIASFLKAISGPVILAGHSYGGAVISVSSAKSVNVKTLVYISAFMPDGGESVLSLLSAYPAAPSDLFTAVPLSSGDVDLYFTPKYYGPAFATGVPSETAAVMAATQRPVTAGALNEAAPPAVGWKTLPSWYVVAEHDGAIPPPLQQMMAERAKASITHVAAGHPSMIQHPEATVAALVAACNSM
jgi:pimeloyl-ACP methyl ester carboxylesterase